MARKAMSSLSHSMGEDSTGQDTDSNTAEANHNRNITVDHLNSSMELLPEHQQRNKEWVMEVWPWLLVLDWRVVLC
jgi:hypothetical protein